MAELFTIRSLVGSRYSSAWSRHLAYAALALASVSAAKADDAAKTTMFAKDVALAPAVAVQHTWPAEQLMFAQSLMSLGLAQLVGAPQAQNVVAAPLSLANALGLVRIGANGRSALELANLFQPSSTGTTLLTRRMGEINTALGKAAEGVTLVSANRIWPSQALAKTLVPAYAQAAQLQFASDTQALGFDKPELAAKTINNWVKDKTEGKISQLLKPEDLKPNTQLVVTNAVYFKGRWAVPFDPGHTSAAPFTLADGSAIQAPTMHATVKARYAELDGVQFLELPYGVVSGPGAGEVVMQIVLPAPSQTLDALQANFSGAQWLAWSAALKPDKVELALPRFSLAARVLPLKPLLQKMGVQAVFSQRADLSGLTRDNSVKLDAVYQSAQVQVDEEGTQAAAASAAVVHAKSLNLPWVMEVNRPFLFIIMHKPTSTVLFVGRVMHPLP